jgi:Uma2 family endonuclease
VRTELSPALSTGPGASCDLRTSDLPRLGAVRQCSRVEATLPAARARRDYNAGRNERATTTRFVTDEELLQAPRDGQKYERVDGEMRVSPAGARHGAISLRLAARLLAFVTERSLGHVFDSSTGFRWPGRKADRPDNVRSPDLSFVASGRFPDEREPIGFPALAPDLAVEVLSPNDRHSEVFEKVGEYLDVGTRLVWVIDPEKRTAAAYRSMTDVRMIGETDALDGEDVVPGFACPLKNVLG